MNSVTVLTENLLVAVHLDEAAPGLSHPLATSTVAWPWRLLAVKMDQGHELATVGEQRRTTKRRGTRLDSPMADLMLMLEFERALVIYSLVRSKDVHNRNYRLQTNRVESKRYRVTWASGGERGEHACPSS